MDVAWSEPRKFGRLWTRGQGKGYVNGSVGGITKYDNLPWWLCHGINTKQPNGQSNLSSHCYLSPQGQHNRLWNRVAMVIGLEAIHGPKSMEYHSTVGGIQWCWYHSASRYWCCLLMLPNAQPSSNRNKQPTPDVALSLEQTNKTLAVKFITLSCWKEQQFIFTGNPNPVWVCLCCPKGLDQHYYPRAFRMFDRPARNAILRWLRHETLRKSRCGRGHLNVRSPSPIISCVPSQSMKLTKQ